LAENDIGAATITLDRPLAADRYADCRETGSFILIDPESCNTVGMGTVETIQPIEARGVARVQNKLPSLIRATETHARSIAKAVSWRATGSPGGRRGAGRDPDQDSPLLRARASLGADPMGEALKTSNPTTIALAARFLSGRFVCVSRPGLHFS
jgi:hypothetical protein